jgi:fluoroacetyl-CoA thioesterase
VIEGLGVDRPELKTGATATVRYVVRETDLASALGIEPSDAFPRVFATSRLVSLMELAAARVMRPLLREGEMSVGVSMNVVHTAATPPGATVRATATYTGRDGKRYVFDIVAEDDGGEIGKATHHRALISVERLEASAAQRSGREAVS